MNFIRRLFFWLKWKFFTRHKPGAGNYRAPKKNHDWNPLLKYPRNEECFCGSGLKFKKCCLNGAFRAVPVEIAEAVKP